MHKGWWTLLGCACCYGCVCGVPDAAILFDHDVIMFCLTPGMPQSPETVARIGQLLQWLLPRCLIFVRHSIREIAPSADGSLAVSVMRLVAALLPADPPASSAESPGTGTHP